MHSQYRIIRAPFPSICDSFQYNREEFEQGRHQLFVYGIRLFINGADLITGPLEDALGRTGVLP